MPEPLHLLRIDLDTGALVRRGRAQGLPLREVDGGYLVHAWLEATFGPAVVRPFALEGEVGRRQRVLGYCHKPLAELREDADRYADASDFAAADWETAATKPMPVAFRAGERLGFAVRAVPTRRSRALAAEGAGPVELDAFLLAARAEAEGPKPERADVYLAWLAEELDRSGGARLVDGSVVAFTLAPLLRRTQGEQRRGRMVTLPDVHFEGTVEITDPEAFSALLARGVGRHRAFGMGMLLLRRPGR
jgi:CRISPR system Cascade subunit CasE